MRLRIFFLSLLFSISLKSLSATIRLQAQIRIIDSYKNINPKIDSQKLTKSISVEINDFFDLVFFDVKPGEKVTLTISDISDLILFSVTNAEISGTSFSIILPAEPNNTIIIILSSIKFLDLQSPYKGLSVWNQIKNANKKIDSLSYLLINYNDNIGIKIIETINAIQGNTLIDTVRAQLKNKKYDSALALLTGHLIDSLIALSEDNHSISTKTLAFNLLALKARAYVLKGELEKADATYIQIFRVDNEAKDYLVEVTDFLLLKGDYLRASELIKRLINLTTETQKKGYLYYILAGTYLSALELDSAISYFQKSSKEYYSLQIIDKFFLPKYAFVKLEELRMKTFVKNQKVKNSDVDSIIDLLHGCDENICKSVLFYSLLSKLNMGSSSFSNPQNDPEAIKEASAELDSTIKIGKELVKINENYEIFLQLLEFGKSLNENSALNKDIDWYSLDRALDKSIAVCKKYSDMQINPPEIHFLDDFSNTFKHIEFKQLDMVSSNIILLKYCMRLTVALGQIEAELPQYGSRKKIIIESVMNLDSIYHKLFLKYSSVYYSSFSDNMMDLSYIAFVFQEYNLAESILIDLTRILGSKRDRDFSDNALLIQAKHSLVLTKFRKIEETNSVDTMEINILYRMTEELERDYRTKYKSVSSRDNILLVEKESKANLKLIKALQKDIINYQKKQKLR